MSWIPDNSVVPGITRGFDHSVISHSGDSEEVHRFPAPATTPLADFVFQMHELAKRRTNRKITWIETIVDRSDWKRSRGATRRQRVGGTPQPGKPLFLAH